MKSVIVCVDTETTGLDPTRHAIIEIAASIVVQGEVAAEWSTLVFPRVGCDVDPDAMTVNGIDLNNFTIGLSADYAISEFLRVCQQFEGRFIWLGHNAWFDLRFVYHAALFGGFNLSRLHGMIDTKALALPLVESGIIPDTHFGTLRTWAGLPGKTAHRALADVRDTLTIYNKLKKEGLA